MPSAPLDSDHEDPNHPPCRACCVKSIENIAKLAIALANMAMASIHGCHNRCYPPYDPREDAVKEDGEG